VRKHPPGVPHSPPPSPDLNMMDLPLSAIGWESRNPKGGGPMGEDEREIVSVVWKELGNRIEVTYAEGEPEKVKAGQPLAADIAKDAGLTVVPTRDGMARRVKNPDMG
jgi:hypothetical protein